MKINFYQKLVLIFFAISIFFSCILFVPFEGWGNKYQPVWFNAYISIQVLLLELFVLVVVFGALFISLNKKSNPDFNNPKTKKNLKREIKFAIGSILLVVVLYGLLELRIVNMDDDDAADFFNLYFTFGIGIIFILFYPFRALIFYSRKLYKFLNN